MGFPLPLPSLGQDSRELTHDIHSAELRPHLDTHPQDHTLNHSRFHELSIRGDGFLTLKSNRIPDLLVFRQHSRVVRVLLPMHVRKNLESLAPPILIGQPTRRFREEEETAEEDYSGHSLDSPGDAERGRRLVRVTGASAVIRRSILNKILDQNALWMVSVCE